MKININHSQFNLFVKKTTFVVFLLLFIFSTVHSQKVNPDISDVKVITKSTVIYKSTNSSEDLKSVKSVVSSNGTKYVLFCDGNLGIAYLASDESGSWKTQVLSGTESDSPTKGEQTRYVALDIDKNDGLHVILVGYPGTMYYGYRPASSSKWEFTEVSKDKMPQLHNFYLYAEYIDMAVDQFNGVHVAAFSEIKSGNSSIYFYKTPGGEWSSEVVRQGKVNTKNDYGNDPSILVKDDKVMLSFGGGWSLTYAEKTIGDSEWNIEELINDNKDSEPQKLATSITVTSEGQPVLSFREYNTNDFRGINVLTKSPCDAVWIRSSVNDESSSGNAIAVDKYGVIWVAYCNDGGYTKLAYRSCTADRSWKNVIKLDDRSKIFLDMFVDVNNHVHLFYSTFEYEIKHIESWSDGNPEIDNNIMPVVTSKMKPYIKTGDFWKTTLKAYDPECDKITFYADELPNGFTLTDHGNGLATLKSDVINNAGDYNMKVYVVDDFHPKGKKPASGINIKLTVSQKGDKKGSYKYFYDEGSFSKNNWMNLDGTSRTTETVETHPAASGTGETSGNSPKIDTPQVPSTKEYSANCNEYLDRFEAWANRYIEVKKKVNSNPMDFGSISKLAALAPELGNWGLEWQQKHECGNDPEYMKRFESINARIEEVNE